MQRRAGQRGRTPASRIKTLYLYARERTGSEGARSFLTATKLAREYFEDETRLIPLELWHSALLNFSERFGKQALSHCAAQVVAPENLGVWTHVLRVATRPSQAFSRLDLFGGEGAWAELWRTEVVRAGYWRGSTDIAADALVEQSGLCAMQRASELAGVPMLFGLGQGTVRYRIVSAGSGLCQEFEVRWREPGPLPLVLGAMAGIVSSLLFALGSALTPALAATSCLLGMALGMLVGFLFRREVRRRAQSRAQMIRIRALERAASLHEARERGRQGLSEGLLVAGQYRLSEQLGVGASGTIWEAERLSDGAIVAIKLLRAAVAQDSVFADRMRREAAALGLAWHPNVVEVYEDGQLADGTSYLVMERLLGESLAFRLKRQSALTPQELLPISLELCDALSAIHAAGIVHRDLKPSNIFLAKKAESKEEHVKVLDFGVARVEWAETRLTNANMPIGTAGYMSPEQEQGLEIDHRSDLFALGSVLHECLSGEPPPLRTTELWDRVLDPGGAESGVQRAHRPIPDAWRRVIERARSQLARDRYPDARAMREELVELAEAERESA